MRSPNLTKTAIWLLVAVDIYIATFFLFARPAKYAGRPDDLYTLELHDKRVCLAGTGIFFSKSPAIHTAAYYFYYPCHWLLEMKGFMFMDIFEESGILFEVQSDR